MAYCGFNYIVIARPFQNADLISDLSLLPTVILRLGDANKAIAGCFNFRDIKDLDFIPVNSDWLSQLSRKYKGVVASPLLPKSPIACCDKCAFLDPQISACTDNEVFVDAFYRIRVCRYHPNAVKLENLESETYRDIPLELIETLTD